MTAANSMERSFSIATLLLAMAIGAVGLASLRALWTRAENGDMARPDAMTMIIAGAVAGLIFGTVLAGWNRPSPVHRLGNVLRMGLGACCGCFLGAAAGAQFSATVPWYVLVMLPVAIIGSTALVVASRRR